MTEMKNSEKLEVMTVSGTTEGSFRLNKKDGWRYCGDVLSLINMAEEKDMEIVRLSMLGKGSGHAFRAFSKKRKPFHSNEVKSTLAVHERTPYYVKGSSTIERLRTPVILSHYRSNS